jgi:hypothetical protein
VFVVTEPERVHELLLAPVFHSYDAAPDDAVQVAVTLNVSALTTAVVSVGQPGAGGGIVSVPIAVTEIDAVPLLPSLLAVMTALPAALPVTTPDALTVAAVVLLELHVTVRPVNTLPPESRSVALSVTVPPTVSAAVLGETVTVATGAAPAPSPTAVNSAYDRFSPVELSTARTSSVLVPPVLPSVHQSRA